MPDNKLTDKEIIKALECCVSEQYTCEQCPYQEKKHYDYDKGFEIMPNGKQYDDWSCDRWLLTDTLDLINRLQAKVDRFEKRQKPSAASGYKIENGKVVFFVDMLGSYSYEYKDLDEVVKTLNELLHEAYSKNEIVFALKCKTEELKTAKAEAYKECIEKAKEEILPMLPFNFGAVGRVFDNLLKELVGEDK